jgi:hypothetical protein
MVQLKIQGYSNGCNGLAAKRDFEKILLQSAGTASASVTLVLTSIKFFAHP